MANQRQIAARLGITQAAVSMALRGDKRISAAMRKRVRETARQLDYHPNAYVNVLMSHIRSGKKLSDKGVIAMLVDTPSLENWHLVETHRLFHQGVLRRGVDFGFRVECFFLKAPNMSVSKFERILHNRGIQGLILAPPYLRETPELHWERYAAIAVGLGWEQPGLDRVAYDQYQQYVTAFRELQALGYRRIGTPLHRVFVDGNRRGARWFSAYLECQELLPRENRIPLFLNPYSYRDGFLRKDGTLVTGKKGEQLSHAAFQKWFKKWRPDALLTLAAAEKIYLDAMRLRVPRDIGLACLSSTAMGETARIDEKGEEVGATAVELVAGKISRNEIGLSSHPSVTMIQGQWKSAPSVRKVC